MAKRYAKKKNDYQGDYNRRTQGNHGEPQKKSSLLSRILLVVFIAVFAVSGAMLVMELVVKPYFNDQSMGEIQKELEQVGGQEEEQAVEIERLDGTKDTVVVNNTVRSVQKLKEKYKDMMGWIKIPGTDIHFPVVQSGQDDPEYYLYRNYRGENTEYGSIFLDARGTIESPNQILHGHSMLDERMFYCLIDFDKPDVYKQSPVIYYDTFEEMGVWKIVSVYKTNMNTMHGEVFDYYTTDFTTQADRNQYVYDIMNRSILDTGVDIQADDRFISLSTCSYELQDFRTVVVARKVRPGEDVAVDTSKVKLRGDETLYPDGWYASFGGNRPNYPASFVDGKAQGMTPWYTD